MDCTHEAVLLHSLGPPLVEVRLDVVAGRRPRTGVAHQQRHGTTEGHFDLPEGATAESSREKREEESACAYLASVLTDGGGSGVHAEEKILVRSAIPSGVTYLHFNFWGVR